MIYCILLTEISENIPLYSPAKSEACLERMFDVKETKYHICPKHCRLFPLNSVDPCKCNALQFKQNGNPIETMSYFPLSRQLAMFIADPYIRESIHEKVSHEADPGILTDIFNGSIYQSFKPTLFRNQSSTNLDLAVSLFVDGFTPFKGGNSRLTIVHLVLLSLPPLERQVSTIIFYYSTIYYYFLYSFTITYTILYCHQIDTRHKT